MGNLTGKGYGNRGTVFTFDVNGRKEVYTSNACRYEDALKEAGLPEGTKLINATTFELLDGKHNHITHVGFIWAVKGASISGKATVKHLVDMGAITEAQAADILNTENADL